MKFFSSLVLAAAYLNMCLSLPIHETRMETNPELLAGYIEGDMVPNMEARNGLRNEWYRWPNNTVFYRFNEGLALSYRNKIIEAMQTIATVSCVRFEEATIGQTQYVNITTQPNGCYSNVGYIRRVQTYNLQLNGCFSQATIIHEFLHTIGFYHMQSASDRNDYVRIAYENIIPGKEHNFNKYSESSVDHFGQEYDYASVMHYGPNSFSANGKATIVPLQNSEESRKMGQRIGMSPRDIKKLNAMYRCNSDS